ncbi:MAG: dihydroorotate dehydrogenase electron transfer subunit [Armatimonadota bacterium]|nr:dihydroorotate dehydrogenase electron transfer subunit [bacterium]
MKGLCECEIIAQSEISPGVVRTLLTGPEIANEAKPGQFVNVQVARTTTDPLLRRPFSVHAVYPDQGVYSLLYVMVGRGTALLNKIQPGDYVSVVGPLGRGFDLGDSPDAEHIVIAGGCGAAPLHFLCDDLCNKWGCEKVKVLTGGRSKNAVLCEAEFRSHGVDVAVSTDDGTYGHHGVVTELLQRYLDNDAQRTTHNAQRPFRIYSCGPHAMMREVARICAEAGVHDVQLSLENNMACGIGVCTGCVQKIKGPMKNDKSGQNWHYERVCKDGPVFNAEDIIWE